MSKSFIFLIGVSVGATLTAGPFLAAKTNLGFPIGRKNMTRTSVTRKGTLQGGPTILWQTPLEQSDFGRMFAVDQMNGRTLVYVQTMEHLYQLDGSTGAVRWAFDVIQNDPSYGQVPAPAVGPDHSVYVAGTNGTLYRLRPTDGAVANSISVPSSSFTTAIVVDGRGIVYASSGNGLMHSYTRALVQRWEVPGAPGFAPVAIGPNRTRFWDDDDTVIAVRD